MSLHDSKPSASCGVTDISDNVNTSPPDLIKSTTTTTTTTVHNPILVHRLILNDVPLMEAYKNTIFYNIYLFENKIVMNIFAGTEKVNVTTRQKTLKQKEEEIPDDLKDFAKILEPEEPDEETIERVTRKRGRPRKEQNNTDTDKEKESNTETDKEKEKNTDPDKEKSNTDTDKESNTDTDKENNTDTEPIKKKRGRPKKNKEEEDFSNSDDSSDNESEEDSKSIISS
ncbi:hypothetical protein HCN44_007752 [Aphidius gifuensis]|uniref:Uncharacterized protein n=1 Tax=Aphidius gifuensis TaxID=684658 RepID=A0A835CPL7_APHGI|nr:hypothetical protein HCN44_007752 [Aphidius gifuensis]